MSLQQVLNCRLRIESEISNLKIELDAVRLLEQRYRGVDCETVTVVDSAEEETEEEGEYFHASQTQRFSPVILIPRRTKRKHTPKKYTCRDAQEASTNSPEQLPGSYEWDRGCVRRGAGERSKSRSPIGISCKVRRPNPNPKFTAPLRKVLYSYR